MTFVEILLLSVSLCVDTLVVSMSGSLTMGKAEPWKIARVALTFGFMQAALLFVGWILGHSVLSYIYRFSRFIGFALLLYIGVMMLTNVFGKNKGSVPVFDTLLIAAVATSIDASAVGVSLAMAEISFKEIYLSVASVFVVTVIAALCGMLGGSYIGRKFGKSAYAAGGIVLILIGIHILVG